MSTREWWCYTFTHTHAHRTSGARYLQHLQECFYYTQVAVYWRFGWWWHTYTHKHIFLLYVYRSIFLALMRRYTQLVYLFHQCAKSLLSTDGCIADCTVRHPGMEPPFSSFFLDSLILQTHTFLQLLREYFLRFNGYFIIHDLVDILLYFLYNHSVNRIVSNEWCFLLSVS